MQGDTRTILQGVMLNAGGSKRSSTVSSKLLVICNAERIVTSRRAEPSNVTATTTKTRSNSLSNDCVLRLLGDVGAYNDVEI